MDRILTHYSTRHGAGAQMGYWGEDTFTTLQNMRYRRVIVEYWMFILTCRGVFSQCERFVDTCWSPGCEPYRVSL